MTDDVYSKLAYYIGGLYRNWKRRYFVLKGNALYYYKNEGDEDPKGSIDLTKGRGIRTKKQTKEDEVGWPKDAKNSMAFAVAINERTYYIYGTDVAEIE